MKGILKNTPGVVSRAKRARVDHPKGWWNSGHLALLALVPAFFLSACDDLETCSVEEETGGAVTIRCDDGTQARLVPPWDESSAELPTPCVAEEVDGGVRISCPGADPVVLPAADGATGPQGPPGPAGEGCRVESAEGGSALRVICGEESALLQGRDADLCEVESRDGDLVLLCADEEVRLSTCGNGEVELGQECDRGEDNGVCRPDPETFVCEVCTETCILETRTVGSVVVEGLVLNVNEGAIGVLPRVRVRSDHGFEALSDDFGRYRLRVPAGEPFTLHVQRQSFVQADLESGNPQQVFFSTAPMRLEVSDVPAEADESVSLDIRLLTGNERALLADEPFLQVRAGDRSAGIRFFTDPQGPIPFFRPGPLRGIGDNSTVFGSLAGLTRSDGQSLRPGDSFFAALVPMGDPEHEEDLLGGGDPLSWRGVQRLGLPPGLEGDRVHAAFWFGLWDAEGEALQGMSGRASEFSVDFAARNTFGEANEPSDLRLLRFDEEQGGWEEAGEVGGSFVDADNLRIWFATVPGPGWYVLAQARSEPAGCVVGRLLLDGEPLVGSVAAWDAFAATAVVSDESGAFCAEGVRGDVSLLSTALPADWDRWLGHARVDVDAGGSCGDSTCVDVGDVELSQLFAQCIPFVIVHDLNVPVNRPVGHRYPLANPAFTLRTRLLAEPQWTLGRVRTLADRRTCVPLRMESSPPVILTDDDDIWCPASASGRLFDPEEVDSVACSSACSDESLPADGDAFFFCGS